MKASTSARLSVKLYMKAGCHLCEAAEADLARLQQRYPHTLERIDIAAESSSDLLQRYGEQIPVVALNGREYAAPLSRTLLERALSEATMQQDQSRAGHDRGEAAHDHPRSGFGHSQPTREQLQPAHEQIAAGTGPASARIRATQPDPRTCDAAPASHIHSRPGCAE